jgi:hypothetical protein
LGRTLIRMRSQVQVLAGPPAIGAAQSAVGSKAGTLAASLGRPGAACPSLPASPSPPSGPVHAAGRRHDNHAPWSTTHPEDGSLAAGAATSPCGLLPCLAPPPVTGARPPRPGLPGRPASSAAAARTRPGPGPPPTARRPCMTSAPSPVSGPARPSTRAAGRRGSPPGPGPVPVVGGAVPPRPVSKRHRLLGDQTDASGRTGGGHQPAGHRRGGHQRAGRRIPDDEPR